MTSRRAVSLAVLGPVVGLLFLACAPKAPAAPDDGWSPKLAPAVVVDATVDKGGPAPERRDLAAELADASSDDVVAAFQQRVTAVGPQHWRVDRQAFDLLLADDARLLLRSCRIVPEEVDGSVAGIRLYGVRRDGIPAILGLVNGDRLDTINGASPSRPDQALTLYTSLRGAHRLDVGITRAGKPMTLTYDLVDGP